MRHFGWVGAVVLFAQLGFSPVEAGGTAAAQADAPAQQPGTGAAAPAQTGLPLPRFVSLKSDEVNLRSGPGRDYPTLWVYRRAGLPLEVVEEFESWRKVRDADGATGWVLQSLLSGRRTALILPWDAKANTSPIQVTIRNDDSERSAPVAIVEAGVIANVLACDKAWCNVTIDRYRGYIEQKKLWGVYDSEVIR